MCSRLIFLLAQCVCGGLSYATGPSAAAAQLAARLAFTPRDYRRINELAALQQEAEAPRRRHDAEAAAEESRRLPLLRQRGPPTVHPQLAYARRPPGYPSPYLEPPAPDSVVADYNAEVEVLPRNHRPEPRPETTRTPEHQSGTAYVRDHAPLRHSETEPEVRAMLKNSMESQVNAKKKEKGKLPAKALELSTDGDRVEFQIQGHEGPKTYIFGYDTGDGKNRQFRLEERLKDGTVKGHYGYYDARGKLRTIRYLARPFEGYREKHHEGNNVSSEEN